MWATELIEELQRNVNEFGDQKMVVPDLLEHWCYDVTGIELDLSGGRIKLNFDA